MTELDEHIIPVKDRTVVSRQHVGDLIYESQNIPRLIISGRSFYGVSLHTFQHFCELVETLPEDEIGNVITTFPPGTQSVTSDVDFFEGNNSPYFATVDSYGFNDASGMPTGQVADVIFKIAQSFATLAVFGLKVNLIYAASVAQSGKQVYWKLDYVVHSQGEAFDGGAVYSVMVAMPVTTTVNKLSAYELYVVPNIQFSSNNVEAEFRLTRLGTSPSDTYGGDIGLKHVVVTT
jgi:hypothetical protein